MLDWGHLHWALTYLTIGSVALYLQYRSNIAAMDKLASAHEQHAADLRIVIEDLQTVLAAIRDREAKS